MRFLTEAYRRIKITIASLSGLTALGALITGIVTGGISGTILVIGGCLWVVTSGFSIFDSVAAHSAITRDVNKLEKNVDIFEQENTKLEGNVRSLEQAKEDYIEQNRLLTTSVKNSQNQIKKLSDLKIKYEEANEKYEKLLEEEKLHVMTLENENKVYISQNVKLSESLDDMKRIQEEFKQESERLSNMLSINEIQIHNLEETKNEYVLENEKLQKTNEESAEQLETLKNQVVKLRELYSNSRELLKNLSDAGDMFSQFGNTLGTSVVDLKDTAKGLDDTQEDFDDTLDQMRKLIEKLKDNTFADLDLDGDGIITKDEFDAMIQNKKS